jgi:hypothetical protein
LHGRNGAISPKNCKSDQAKWIIAGNMAMSAIMAELVLQWWFCGRLEAQQRQI